ncbi:DUF6221 family protein [Streptomyces sp. NPDC056486]|uniref:DUF6221 family protein n=1 Tax=Streptomyces sp. NPDC056486 TaxID=3345835 RepID=UPI0036918612
MDDLVQWLGEQLDEEQREAEDALKKTTTTRRRIGGRWVEDVVQPPEWRRSAWSPARVLREIDADRRILDLYVTAVAERVALRTRMRALTDKELDEFGRLHAQESVLIETGRRLAPIVRLLALPYEDRPGYREEWRP